MAQQSTRKGSRAAPSKSRSKRKRSRRPRRSDSVGRNVAAVRDVVTKSVLAPLNAVLLTRKLIEEVVDDAVRRGRMTRDDAQQLLQALLQRGAKQTDDFLSDLDRLLGRGRELQTRSDAASRTRTKRATASSNLPIPDYDELSAAAVQDRLQGLTPAELRKLRDYERKHANRKTVLDPIERKLR